jgi:acetylornithine deacetylase
MKKKSAGSARTTTHQEVIDEIEGRRDEIVRVCRDLVRHDTTVHAEAAQRYVEQLLLEAGVETDVFEPDNERIKVYPDYGPGNDYRGKPNVVGTIRGEGNGRSLILNAHVDTVSAEPLADWKLNPFDAVVLENRIYGRGTADDKGDLAAMLMAARILREMNITLLGDLMLESVVGEETDGNGTLSCCDRGYRADAAIVVDSIDPIDRIVVAQAGVTYYKLKITGRSAHLCQKFTPLEGVSAIDKMMIILKDLEELQKERSSYRDPQYWPKVPIVGVTSIQGGGVHSRSSFPQECSIEVEYDYFASELGGANDDLPIRRAILRRIREVERSDEWLAGHPSSIEWLASILPTTIERGHPIVSTLGASIERVVTTPELIPIATSTDARHFEHVAGTPVVSWSCGGNNAHGVDESIGIEDLINGTKILALTILDWCGYNE